LFSLEFDLKLRWSLSIYKNHLSPTSNCCYYLFSFPFLSLCSFLSFIDFWNLRLRMERAVLDGIINRLLEVRGRPGKQVQLSEPEIKQLCLVSRDIFSNQPNLLELEAPLKICGTFLFFPPSTTSFYFFLNFIIASSSEFCDLVVSELKL